MNESNATSDVKLSGFAYLLERFGVPLAMCGLLAYVLFVKMDQLGYKIDRCIRNERAMMQKMGIPLIVAPDKWAEEK